MGDLISRKTLLDAIDDKCLEDGSYPGFKVRVTSTTFTAKELFYMICKQPIAFDPEMVIEKLQKKYEEAGILAKHAKTLDIRANYVCAMDAYNEAIMIVKAQYENPEGGEKNENGG